MPKANSAVRSVPPTAVIVRVTNPGDHGSPIRRTASRASVPSMNAWT